MKKGSQNPSALFKNLSSRMKREGLIFVILCLFKDDDVDAVFAIKSKSRKERKSFFLFVCCTLFILLRIEGDRCLCCKMETKGFKA